jgi:hypothetical protein
LGGGGGRSGVFLEREDGYKLLGGWEIKIFWGFSGEW